MATITFRSGTPVPKEWLNEVDALRYDSDGTAYVKHTPYGADATARDLQTKLRELEVSPSDYSGADDTAKANAAITAMNALGGGRVVIKPGSYTWTTVNLKSNVELHISAGATITRSAGSATTRIISGEGSLGTGVNLSGNATEGDTSVTVGDASTFTEGGWVLIRDDVYIASTNGRNQEIAKISTISGTTINLESQLIGSYATAQTAQILPLTPIENASVTGRGKLVISTGTAGGGVLFDLSVGAYVGPISVFGPNDNGGVEFQRSYNFIVDGAEQYDGQNTGTGGFGYGVVINQSSHHGRVVNAHTERCRESVIGNRSRFIDVLNSRTRNCVGGWNTHGNGSQFVRFIDGMSDGDQSAGFWVGHTAQTGTDSDIMFINCEVINNQGHGFQVIGTSLLKHERVHIINPKVRNPGLGGGTVYGIYVFYGNNVKVENPMIEAGSSTFTAGIHIQNATDPHVRGGHIVGGVDGIEIQDTTRHIIDRVDFKSQSGRIVEFSGTNVGPAKFINCTSDTSVIVSDGVTDVYGNSWQEARQWIKDFDDFLGDTVDANKWQTQVGTDGQCTAAATLANQVRGIAFMTFGDDAAGTMATNGSQFSGALNYQANNDFVEVEFRVLLSAITDVALFVGLTDQVASLEMPFTLGAADALTSNATDAVGFLFDTAADTDNWWVVGVANDVDATKQNLGIAPVASTYEVLKVRLTTTGVATFFRNGVQVGTAMTGAVTATVPLAPVVAGFSRTTTTRQARIDYFQAQMERA